MNNKLKRLTALSLLCSSSVLHAHGDTASIGAGVGTQYGLIGINGNLKITDNLYASAGLGTTFIGTGWSVGAKYYFLDANRIWRPRLIATYGTNAVLVTKQEFWNDTIRTEESFTGFSLGLGQSFAFGSTRSHGFDFDIMYRVTDGGYADHLSELENIGLSIEDNTAQDISFSLGYRYNF